MATWRSGRRPRGTPTSEVMPTNSRKRMADTDLLALYRY